MGQHIIDPAAQTELSLILQQCGFTAGGRHFHEQAGYRNYR